MKPVSVYSGGYYTNNDNYDITKHTKIFTDRSIYRPGQNVLCPEWYMCRTVILSLCLMILK